CGLLLQLGVAHRRKHADVLLERGEVDHDAVELERRDPVAYLPPRLRYGLRDRRPYLPQDRLDVRRKGRDVVVDRRWCGARLHWSFAPVTHSLRGARSSPLPS